MRSSGMNTLGSYRERSNPYADKAIWRSPQPVARRLHEIRVAHPCVLYTYNHNIDLRTAMNERTHFFIKKYISHTLFSKGLMFLWCVRDEWRQGQTAILTQLLLLTIAYCYLQEPTEHFFGILARVAQPGVAKRHSPQGAFSVCKLVLTLAFWSPTNSTAAGICPYFITSTCFRFFFRLFTQVHLWLTARSRVNI